MNLNRLIMNLTRKYGNERSYRSKAGFTRVEGAKVEKKGTD